MGDEGVCGRSPSVDLRLKCKSSFLCVLCGATAGTDVRRGCPKDGWRQGDAGSPQQEERRLARRPARRHCTVGARGKDAVESAHTGLFRTRPTQARGESLGCEQRRGGEQGPRPAAGRTIGPRRIPHRGRKARSSRGGCGETKRSSISCSRAEQARAPSRIREFWEARQRITFKRPAA